MKTPLIDALKGAIGGAVDPTLRARENSQAIEQSIDAVQGVISGVEDMYSAAANHQQKFGHWNCLRAAKVVYSVPYLNWCRIQFDNGGQDYPACALTECSSQGLGIRNSSPIPPETMVLALWDPESPFAIIIGCMPEIVSDGSRAHAGVISQGSNAGFKRERYYKDMPSLLKENAGWIDWSNNRPIDGLAIGEWARFDDLGGGFFMDPMMKFMRIDESCGLWLYYMDRLARLMCNNLDVISSVHEQVIRNDSGEGLNMTGASPYYWEALGVFRKGTDTHREVSNDDVHFHKPYGTYEPKHDDQQAFYRYEEFRDYLGQGFMRQMMLPPYSPPEYNRYSGEDVRVGVFREQVALDGSWTVSSAHSISLCKRLLIPIPKRMLPPEDPTGEDLELNEDKYKFAGAFGSGPEHKITDTPRAPDGADLPHVLTAAAMSDVAAYHFNWKHLHPFHYHLRDFDTPQQEDLEPFTTLQYKPEYSELDGKMWLDRPLARTVPVDHRYDADYYETTAGYFITPEGNLIMRDGSGVAFQTAGGNAMISAPGDIIIQPGRSVIIYAGDDVVVKAHKSVDITASKHDVRIKAEHNAEILAGNSGSGRLLLESKAVGSSFDPDGNEGEDVDDPGILIKNANGPVALWAKDIYARTIGADTGSGRIVLDAGKGLHDIELVGRELHAHLANEAVFSFPVEEPSVVHTFGRSYSEVQSQLRVGSTLSVLDGGVLCQGGLSVVGGEVIQDSNASGHMIYFAPGSDNHKILTDRLAVLSAASVVPIAAQNAHMQAVFAKDLWSLNRVGHDDVIEQTAFAPRNDKQLNVTDFRIPASYWQQLAGDTPPATWDEPIISYQGQNMMPHPGYDKWSAEETLLKPQLQLHKPDTGLDQPRAVDDNPYDDPTLLDWKAVIPDGNYPIITSS